MAGMTETVVSEKSPGARGMDPRFKMAFLALLSGSTVGAGPPGLLLLFLFLCLAMAASRISIGRFLKETRYFAVFLFFVFIARALSTPGEKLFQDLLPPYMPSLTMEGVSAGAAAAFRLFLIVMLGFLFMETTTSSKVRAAVVWFLKPVPLVPERRVASMLGLLMRFLPLIVRQARETADAQRARCADCRKNPVRRIVKLAIPILRKIFLRADELVMAMEARGYDENRTMPKLAAGPVDWIVLALLLPFSLLLPCF